METITMSEWIVMGIMMAFMAVMSWIEMKGDK